MESEFYPIKGDARTTEDEKTEREREREGNRWRKKKVSGRRIDEERRQKDRESGSLSS